MYFFLCGFIVLEFSHETVKPNDGRRRWLIISREIREDRLSSGLPSINATCDRTALANASRLLAPAESCVSSSSLQIGFPLFPSHASDSPKLLLSLLSLSRSHINCFPLVSLPIVWDICRPPRRYTLYLCLLNFHPVFFLTLKY